MSERYVRIYEGAQNLWVDGAPVLISAHVLLKDQQVYRSVAQIKFQNIQKKTVDYLKAEITPLDAVGQPAGEPIEKEYFDLSARQYEEFGAKTAVVINTPSARSFTVKVLCVAFADKTIWNGTGDWTALAQDAPLLRQIAEARLVSIADEHFARGTKEEILAAKALYERVSSVDVKEKAAACEQALEIMAQKEEAEKQKAAAKKKKKKKAILIIAAVLALLLIAGGVFAFVWFCTDVGTLSFYENETGYSVKCNKSFIKEVDIPAEHNGRPVTAIGYSAFNHCTDLTSVTIPDSVTVIDAYAFDSCFSLENVKFGSGLREIGFWAFANTGLTKIELPDSLTDIDTHAFMYCSSLKEVNLGSGSPKINDEAFYGCTNVKHVTVNSDKMLQCVKANSEYLRDSVETVTIGDQVSSIGSWCFDGFKSLKTVHIGNSVKKIGQSAFAGCAELESVTIPDSVTELDSYAFSGCLKLGSATVGKGLTSIYSPVFFNCPLLEKITWNAIDCEKNVNVGDMPLFQQCPALTTVEFGDETKTIPDYAFCALANLINVKFGKSITTIGESAFAFCAALDAAIPESVQTIKKDAFAGCKSLTNVVIPDNVRQIGEGAFRECTNLTKVVIGKGITKISWRAFSACSQLKVITIPKETKEIDGIAFGGCPSLSKVLYRGSKADWNKIVVNDSKGIYGKYDNNEVLKTVQYVWNYSD